MDDLISRQAAIDAIVHCTNCGTEEKLRGYVVKHCLDTGWTGGVLDALDAVEDLPSAQPEVIHCGDCKYKDDGIDEDGVPFLKCLNGRSYGGTRINDYCSWAERRQND